MIEIDSAKLVKKGERLKVSYTRTETDGRKIIVSDEEGQYSCHEDLIAAFDALAPHVAMLGGYKPFVKNFEKIKEDDFEGFRCTSYSISGQGDARGVVLTASHLRWDGKAVGYNCPFDTFEEGDGEDGRPAKAKPYPFMDELTDALDLLDTEVRWYMDGSKKGPEVEKKKKTKKGVTVNPNQLDLEAEADKITKAQIAIPSSEMTEPDGPLFQEGGNGEDDDEDHDLSMPLGEANDPAFDAADRMRKAGQNKKSGIPPADPHAMARVAGKEPLSSPEGVVKYIVDSTNAGKPETAAQRKKRVAQSAANPSGLADEETK